MKQNSSIILVMGALIYVSSTVDAADISGEKMNRLDAPAGHLQEGCPQEMKQAIACFKSKAELILSIATTFEKGGDVSNLMVVARFIGDIRSRIIPDYK